ncbi:integrase catalytic domain-containing protein [Trichonephila clavipes]|nr:integrase catalytic domain-containing protein [Trichonephila clavipes]
MNLNALKAQRKGLRTAFSNCLKKIETELAQELCNFETLSVLKIQFNDKFARMDSCQKAISETLLLSDDGEHLFAEDLEDAEIYREKFWELTTKIELKSQQCTVPSDKESRKFKLSKIELKKFNGEAKEYLTFWSQFQKIHEDRGIAAEDKMQYLLQWMEPGSKAERLVLSFPATAANYPKAIDQLKERFGREDILVQIYVRDLLTLVMKNAATGRAKVDLPLFYDELESKLRSLESLGKTQDKYGDFLTPLVESCLPEEVFVACKSKTVFLQTLCVIIRCQGQEKLIRAVIDSGSQRNGNQSFLIGADVLGKLLTGNSVELESGLTAVQTKLGISSPTEIEKQKTELSLNDFNNRIKILPDGRYEVELPWKYDSLKLPSNKELVWKRPEGMINRFGCGKFFMDYQKVFQDWEKLNIIERVPDLELNKECHYLAHRPVIKLDSQTTKIRPVFDASASEKGKPSLNECLLKGTNLIELIPDILDRFRMYPIGISADIEKAFLMLSVAPKDRDFLRFFSPSSEGRIVYRHCRVVFGVSSSPFLLNASVMHLLENCQPQHEEVAQKLKSSFYVDNCVSGVFNTDEQGRFIEHAKLIMLNGCFNLRGFESNVAGKNVDRSSGDTSVLGVIWNLETDTLKCCTDMWIL